MAYSLPIIDLEINALHDESWGHRVGDALKKAFTEDGFLYLVNHGISESAFEEVRRVSLDFFTSPAELKQSVATSKIHRGYHALGGALMEGAAKPDQKEFFQLGLDLPDSDIDVLAGKPLRGANQWPAGKEEFRSVMEAYFKAIAQVGEILLRAVAWSLGIKPSFFAEKYTKPLQRTQAIYYPANNFDSSEEAFGVAPHSDYGCITLLYQDDVGGLQVLNRKNEWIDASPIPGSLVVNVGDLLERWSNGRFVSTKHAVKNLSGKERISVATFYDPSYNANVSPIDLGIPPEDSKFEPILAGDHIQGRINRSFGYTKQ